MRTFLKENWIWILAPAVLLVVLAVIRRLMSGSGVAPFEYALF